MKKVFIIGASGYIGKRLRASLENTGHMLVKTVGRRDSDHFIDLGTDDTGSFLEIVGPGDFVILLSAISSPDVCAQEFDKAWAVNVQGTVGLIERLSKKSAHIIFASSDTVVGAYGDEPVTEDMPLKPYSVYGVMKAAVETVLRGNDSVKIARLSYVFSRSDKFTDMVLQSVSADNPLSIFRGFERCVVSLGDVLTGIERMILGWDEIEAQVINFAGPNLIDRREMVEELCAFDTRIKFFVDKAPEAFYINRPKTINLSYNAFEDLLGRSPLTVNSEIQKWK
jgi:nucleoside-diphosphate-sugar epimerase